MWADNQNDEHFRKSIDKNISTLLKQFLIAKLSGLLGLGIGFYREQGKLYI